MELEFENLKQLKATYEHYSEKYNMNATTATYKRVLAERIIQTQDYIIEKLLEERMMVKTE